jgi:aerobic carbon-monoxide dehydrogenase large subunit
MASPSSDGTALRREDPPLVTGAARYCDDLAPPGALHAVFVRAPLAHGRILGIDPAPAAAKAGVAGVYTAAGLGLPPLPPGDGPAAMARPVLATGTVRFLGEAVAVVVAETRAQAMDAAEAVEVDYEPLEVLTDPRAALAADAPQLFEGSGNLAKERRWPEPSRALEGAEVVVRGRFVNQRVAAAPIEPNAAVAVPEPERDGLTLYVPSQAPFWTRDTVAEVLGLRPEQVRVVVPAVGGAFGARIHTYPEQVAVAALARRLGRPVRYVESRSETMLAMTHGRAQAQEVELAATRDGRITGLRARLLADGGAYPADAPSMPSSTRYMASGVYRIARVEVAWECAVTNTTPVAAYRGAGRPEATAMVERAVDLLAARLRIDPAELRRRNLIPARAFPYTTATRARYDSGDYQGALDRVLEAAGYRDLRAEQAARRQRGEVRQLGIGLSVYVEVTGFGSEYGEVTVEPDGRVTARTGVSPHGQGHETTFAQLVADTLGVGAEQVGVVHSDTFALPRGDGTMGSRSLQVGGSAMAEAAGKVLSKARALAAHLLEAPAEDVAVFPGEGLGVAGAPSTALGWAELAAAAADPDRRPPGMDAGLEAAADFRMERSTFPFGAHLAVCEVDTETGLARLLRHLAVDDAGRVHNRMLAEGQVLGGIAQGVAQALFEEVGYDTDGNCLHGNLASYAMPSAADLPAFESIRMETPTPLNPLGAKGIGESGTIGATPAVQNAVVDALSHLGVTHIDMPLTPERVWRAIQDAKGLEPPSAAAGRFRPAGSPVG